jgi:hypothetical protein
VLEVDTGPQGWPADYIDTLAKRYQATMPDPRLPADSSEETEQ